MRFSIAIIWIKKKKKTNTVDRMNNHENRRGEVNDKAQGRNDNHGLCTTAACGNQARLSITVESLQLSAALKRASS